MFKKKTAMIVFPTLGLLLMLAAFQWPAHNPQAEEGAFTPKVIYQEYNLTLIDEDDTSVTITIQSPASKIFNPSNFDGAIAQFSHQTQNMPL